jgi:hypothetical protein
MKQCFETVDTSASKCGWNRCQAVVYCLMTYQYIALSFFFCVCLEHQWELLFCFYCCCSYSYYYRYCYHHNNNSNDYYWDYYFRKQRRAFGKCCGSIASVGSTWYHVVEIGNDKIDNHHSAGRYIVWFAACCSLNYVLNLFILCVTILLIVRNIELWVNNEYGVCVCVCVCV